jgi:alpha-aminoadipate carrier protein LysW
MVTCPLCESDVDVDEDELDEGDSLICGDCGASLTVTGTSPLELSPDAGDEDDDDEDDDEDYGDDYDDDDDDDFEDEEDEDEK